MLEKLPETLGHALINQRAGMGQVLYNQLHAHRAVERMPLSSHSFAFNAALPVKFTADGEGISPHLAWEGVPDGAASIVLIVEDADSPTPHPLVHAIAVALPPNTGSIEEGALSSPGHSGARLETGRNSFLQKAWLPPDPPPGHGRHRYVFQVFALRPGAAFSATPGRGEVSEAILDRAIAVGCLIGTYERSTEITVATDDGVSAGAVPA